MSNFNAYDYKQLIYKQEKQQLDLSEIDVAYLSEIDVALKEGKTSIVLVFAKQYNLEYLNRRINKYLTKFDYKVITTSITASVETCGADMDGRYCAYRVRFSVVEK